MFISCTRHECCPNNSWHPSIHPSRFEIADGGLASVWASSCSQDGRLTPEPTRTPDSSPNFACLTLCWVEMELKFGCSTLGSGLGVFGLLSINIHSAGDCCEKSHLPRRDPCFRQEFPGFPFLGHPCNTSTLRFLPNPRVPVSGAACVSIWHISFAFIFWSSPFRSGWPLSIQMWKTYRVCIQFSPAFFPLFGSVSQPRAMRLQENFRGVVCWVNTAGSCWQGVKAR